MNDHLFGRTSRLADPLGLKRFRELSDRLSGRQLAGALALGTPGGLGAVSHLDELLAPMRAATQHAAAMQVAGFHAKLAEEFTAPAAMQMSEQVSSWVAEAAALQMPGFHARLADLTSSVEFPGITAMEALQASAASAVASVPGIGEHLADLISSVEFPGITAMGEQWGELLLGTSTLEALRERMAVDVEPLLAAQTAETRTAVREWIDALSPLPEAAAEPFVDGPEPVDVRGLVGQAAAATAALLVLYGTLHPDPEIRRVIEALALAIGFWIALTDYLARGE